MANKREYLNRITDTSLQLKLEAFGAALIVGPKGCGKTITAKKFAKSYVEFQDEDNRDHAAGRGRIRALQTASAGRKIAPERCAAAEVFCDQ